MGRAGSSKEIDDAVGTLVWIRRRNGSWWPGRIMGLDELQEGCMVSCRTGTPVKLLGREDASVEWYNLEKSKRVKAFRCGEYDKCIEKAKASATNATKKAVKYARREDAILHALELEKARESDENHVSQSKVVRSTCKRQGLCLSTSDSEDDDMTSKETATKENLKKELSQSGLTFENPNNVSTMQTDYLQRTRRKTPYDSENDDIEGTKRMRGLQDLGMGILPQRKTNVHSDSERSDELVRHDTSSEPNICSSGSDGSPVIKSLDACSFGRKMPAQVPLTNENLKRKKRCLPLKKVLESTTMVSLPVLGDQCVNPGQSSLRCVADNKVSALESPDSEKPNTSRGRKFLSNASLYNCDGGVKAGYVLSDAKDTDISTVLELPQIAVTQHGNLQSVDDPLKYHDHSKDGLDELGSTSHIVDTNNLSSMIGKHTSEWQSKGKRNSRTLSHRTRNQVALRKSVDKDSESDISLNGKHHTDDFFQGFGCKAELDTLNHSLDLENSGPWSSKVSESTYLDSTNYGKKENLSISDDISEAKDRKLNLSHEKGVVAKPAMQARNKELYLIDDSAFPLVPHRSLPYRQSRFTPHSKFQDAYVPNKHIFGNSSLFDVDLEVRASKPGRHVPLVSLMSKLNRKAIVGHPVTVEVCEDGSSDLLLNGIDHLVDSSDELYEDSEDVSDQSTDVPGSSLFHRRYSKSVGSLQTKTGHGPKQPPHYKSFASQKKPSKAKKSGNVSKKTRKLSSLVALSGRNQDRNPVVDKLGGPVIACVPLNIVFSRLSELLGGSSRSTTHRKSTLGSTC